MGQRSAVGHRLSSLPSLKWEGPDLPDPEGPGQPCHDKLTWLQLMLDRTLAAFQQRGLWLPAPLVVADSWFGDAG